MSLHEVTRVLHCCTAKCIQTLPDGGTQPANGRHATAVLSALYALSMHLHRPSLCRCTAAEAEAPPAAAAASAAPAAAAPQPPLEAWRPKELSELMKQHHPKELLPAFIAYQPARAGVQQVPRAPRQAAVHRLVGLYLAHLLRQGGVLPERAFKVRVDHLSVPGEVRGLCIARQLVMARLTRLPAFSEFQDADETAIHDFTYI